MAIGFEKNYIFAVREHFYLIFINFLKHLDSKCQRVDGSGLSLQNEKGEPMRFKRVKYNLLNANFLLLLHKNMFNR